MQFKQILEGWERLREKTKKVSQSVSKMWAKAQRHSGTGWVVGCIGEGQKRWGWGGKCGLRPRPGLSGPSWAAVGSHVGFFWPTCFVLFFKKSIKSTFKNQILHKSTFLASFDKKKKIRSVNTGLERTPTRNTQLEGSWGTFRWPLQSWSPWQSAPPPGGLACLKSPLFESLSSSLCSESS